MTQELPEGTVTVLFTDVVGSTEMRTNWGDASAQRLMRTHFDFVRRICAHAGPGEILASDVVRQLAAGKEFLFSDRGETELRGFEDPVKLGEVRWRQDS